MNASPRPPDEWTACPAGELQRLVRTQQVQQRLRRWSQLAATTAAVLVCLAGYLALALSIAPDTGLGCRECKTLFVPYHAQTLAPPRAEQVRAHLDRCRKCRDAYQDQFPARRVSLEVARFWLDECERPCFRGFPRSPRRALCKVIAQKYKPETRGEGAQARENVQKSAHLLHP